MDQLISIVMPAYNMSQYIAQSIQSVQSQTYQSWKLIVINDGSQDDTEQIVERFAQEDTRIILINQNNSGVSAARNVGIEAAYGNYISFLDADDMWHPSFLQDMVNAVVKNPQADLFYCGYEKLLDSGKIRKYKYEYLNGNILLDTVQEKTWVPIQGILASKKLIDKYDIRFPAGCAIGEDLEFLFKILAVAKVAAVPKTLVTYRLRDNSVSQVTNWQKQMQVIDALERVIEFVRIQCSNNENETTAKVLQEKMAYSLFRIAWTVLKSGLYDDVRHILQDDRYVQILRSIDTEKMRLRNRTQYWILISNNQLIWKLFS